MHIVAKFGGTSLADSKRIKRAAEIIKSNPDRRYIVVSAPGCRHKGDTKVTDLLYSLCGRYPNGEPVPTKDELLRKAPQLFDQIFDRFSEIKVGLGVTTNLDEVRENMENMFRSGVKRGYFDLDYFVTRGEYLNAVMIAEYLGFEFVDATSLIRLGDSGSIFEEETRELFDKNLRVAKAVIPGFYGGMTSYAVKSFSRGGSDVSGAIVAAYSGAKLYENWTDVDGVCSADPRIVPDPQKIEVITYRELREMAYMGASVLHDEAVFPVREVGIPIRIRNSGNPDNPGTLVVHDVHQPSRTPGSIVGIAGRTGFSIIHIHKVLMNSEVGYVRKVCEVLEELGIGFEHMPSGIDTLSIIVDSAKLTVDIDELRSKLEDVVEFDIFTVKHNIALICTVGAAMAHTPGVAAKLFGAVANVGVNVSIINQGSSEMSIIIGVDDKDYEAAVLAIYRTFVGWKT